MTFEAMPAAEAQPLDKDSPAPASVAATGEPDPILDPRALQILSTEHWSLLTARSLADPLVPRRTGLSTDSASPRPGPRLAGCVGGSR